VQLQRVAHHRRQQNLSSGRNKRGDDVMGADFIMQGMVEEYDVTLFHTLYAFKQCRCYFPAERFQFLSRMLLFSFPNQLS
jgi:hypothetical protein